MEVLLVLVPFITVGLLVMFVAFSGGPSAARQAYLSRGGRGGRVFSLSMVVLYVALGVAVPAAVIASRGEAKGGTGNLRTSEVSAQEEEGKTLFISTCKSCHTLAAVQAHGVTGPSLDDLGGIDKERVLTAIERGGSGTGRMPAELLEGEDAEAVAAYVAAVAGR